MPDDPEIKQKGKAVIIELPDSLRPATTYTINFGNAITDLNEGNALENYAFVFSTGPVLDSITLSGTVMDAVTLKAAEGVWVMLYSIGEDSAVYKRKPDYIARSNSSGRWTMSFLPADSFAVYALKDENVNFLYDQEAELFGWLDEIIYTGDHPGELPPILVFPREGRTVVKEVTQVVPGWMKIIVDAPFPKPIPTLLPAIDSAFTMWDRDTLHVWYHPERNYTGYVVLQNDSTIVKASTRASTISQPMLIRQVSGRLKPGSSAIFSLNIPVVAIDSSLILYQIDSLNRIPVSVKMDSNDLRRFSVTAPWKTETRNPIIFLPGAVTDFWGRVNDTIKQSIVVSSAEQFGDLYMSIDGLDSTQQYVIYLKEGEQIIDTFVVVEKTQARMIKTGLLPAKYTIDVIHDANRNGVWDTGNFDLKRQPEKKLTFMPEALRAGWEQEVKMNWK